MYIQNIALYEDQYYIYVNKENDPLFYFFDYDTRTADINMQFQHFHTFYELWVPMCPHASHLLEGKRYEMQTLDILCIAPNALHMSHYPEGEPCKRLIVRFNIPKTVPGLGNEYEQLLGIFQKQVPIFRFAPELRSRIFRKLNDIFTLAQKTDPLRDLIIHLKFIEFLTLLYLHQDQNEYANESQLLPTQKKIYDVASYIHTHYAEPLTLDFLAQEFFISTCYLSHQFKDTTGFTLTDYIQMTRVRNVQSLLINTMTPITEAALSCGFTSFSQFNRVFRKHIGMAPSQYRKQYGMSAG